MFNTQKIGLYFATAFLIFGEMFSAVAEFTGYDSENLGHIDGTLSRIDDNVLSIAGDLSWQNAELTKIVDRLGYLPNDTVLGLLSAIDEQTFNSNDNEIEIIDIIQEIEQVLRYIYRDVQDIEDELKEQSDLMKESSATVRGISNDVSRLSQTVRRDDGLSYLLVSNLNTQAVSPIDLSILTNAILGSAFVRPDLGWGDYYSIYDAYKDGAIDPDIFIAELGLYNWLAGLNFGDWWVSTPDDEDQEDSERWGKVEQAKQYWSPLAEATMFTPYETSEARYFLYGTRDMTDAAITNVYFTQLMLNALHAIRDAVTDNVDPGEPSSEETFPTKKLSEDFPEIEDELKEEPIEGIGELLNTTLDNDGISSIEQSLSQFREAVGAVNTSGEGKVSFDIELDFLGIREEVTLTLDEVKQFTDIYDKVTAFISWGFKIAVSLMILASAIRATYSELNDMPLWYS